ncbi:unnamed protein product [Urochloa humidicola]
MAAERMAYREHYLSRSGKKKDDYYQKSRRQMDHEKFWNGRWIRKFLSLPGGSMETLEALQSSYEGLCYEPFAHLCFSSSFLHSWGLPSIRHRPFSFF